MSVGGFGTWQLEMLRSSGANWASRCWNLESWKWQVLSPLERGDAAFPGRNWGSRHTAGTSGMRVFPQSSGCCSEEKFQRRCLNWWRRLMRASGALAALGEKTPVIRIHQKSPANHGAMCTCKCFWIPKTNMAKSPLSSGGTSNASSNDWVFHCHVSFPGCRKKGGAGGKRQTDDPMFCFSERKLVMFQKKYRKKHTTISGVQFFSAGVVFVPIIFVPMV